MADEVFCVNIEESVDGCFVYRTVDSGQLITAEPCHEVLAPATVAEWSDKATRLLINLYREKKKDVEERKIKTMKKMWSYIREGLSGYGYLYTDTQCESKWKALERAYKKVIENKNSTGRGRKTCPYEKELAEIFEKRHSMFPVVTMGTGTPSFNEKKSPETESLSGKYVLQDSALEGICGALGEMFEQHYSYPTITTAGCSTEEPSGRYQVLPNIALEGTRTTNPGSSADLPTEVPRSSPGDTCGPALLSSQRKRSKLAKAVSTAEEIKKIRVAIEDRNKQKIEMENKRAEQKKELIEQMRMKNELLKAYVEGLKVGRKDN